MELVYDYVSEERKKSDNKIKKILLRFLIKNKLRQKG